MKLFLILLSFQLSTLFACSQQTSDYDRDIEIYKTTKVPSRFKSEFNTSEDERNFRLLREFLDERQSLSLALKNETLKYKYSNPSYINYYQSNINRLSEILTNGKESTVEVDAYLIYNAAISDTSSGDGKIKVSRSRLTEIIEQQKTSVDQIKRDTAIVNRLNENLGIVREDIYQTRKQIDSALAPEYEEQAFRTNISICFTILIAILLVSFFLIVFKRSDNNLSKELLSGNGLQFITLFVLIIAVILFGILNILQSSELAAILSGISGYILGKGTISQKTP